MNWSHALAQADKHSRWHLDHPEGGCEELDAAFVEVEL